MVCIGSLSDHAKRYGVVRVRDLILLVAVLERPVNLSYRSPSLDHRVLGRGSASRFLWRPVPLGVGIHWGYYGVNLGGANGIKLGDEPSDLQDVKPEQHTSLEHRHCFSPVCHHCP